MPNRDCTWRAAFHRGAGSARRGARPTTPHGRLILIVLAVGRSEACTMTPKPPMFSSPSHGLPLPVQFLARARLFMKFAIGGVAYDNGEMNWPKYALLLQAIELALKAYCLQDGRQEPKGLHNHDLKGWYDLRVYAAFLGCPTLRLTSTFWGLCIWTAARVIRRSGQFTSLRVWPKKLRKRSMTQLPV